MVEKYKLYSRSLFTIFWVMTCSGFVFQMLPLPEQILSFLLLLCDFVLVVLGVSLMRNRGDVIVILSYVAIASISTLLINHLSLLDLINGSRDFFGLLFVIPILRWFFDSKHRDEFVASFEKQLKIWLYLQAICATIQFMMYEDFDEVGGTMGMGASGFLSMFLYLTSFYFVRKKWDSEHYFRSIKENLKFIILLYPSFLNETKASFVYLILYFVLLMKFDKMLLLKVLYIVPISIISLIFMFNVYCSVTNQDPDEVFSVEFLEQYMFSGDVDLDFTIEAAQMLQDGDFDDNFDSTYWWTVDVPRYAKFVIIGHVMQYYPGGYLLGLGIGHFKGTRMMNTTDFAREYQWAIQGSRVWTFTVIMQLGILGLIWCIWLLVRIVKGRLYGHFAGRVRLFIIACMTLIFLYNETFRLPNLCIMMFFMLFAIHSQLKTQIEQKRLLN